MRVALHELRHTLRAARTALAASKHARRAGTAAGLLVAPVAAAVASRQEQEREDTSDWLGVPELDSGTCAACSSVDGCSGGSRCARTAARSESAARESGRTSFSSASSSASGPSHADAQPAAHLRLLSLDGFGPDDERDSNSFHNPDPYAPGGKHARAAAAGGGGAGSVGAGGPGASAQPRWDDGVHRDDEEHRDGHWDSGSSGSSRSRSSTGPSSASSSSSAANVSRGTIWDEGLTKALEEALGGGGGSGSSNSGGGTGAAAGGGAGHGPGEDKPKKRKEHHPFEQQQRILLQEFQHHPNKAGLQTTSALLWANVGVYLLWKIPHPRVRAFLERNFLTSPAHMAARGFPKGWATCLWSSYSHSSFLHLAANMLGLVSFAPSLMDKRVHSVATPVLAPASFMGMYTAAGFLGSVGSNLFSAACGSSRPGLGASGSIFAVLTYHTFCHPNSGVVALFVIHTDAVTALSVGTLLNVWLSWRQWSAARRGLPGPMIDGMAHLVGTAVGAGWFYASQAGARASGAPERPVRRTAPRSSPGGGHGHGHGHKHPPGAVDV